MKKIEVKELEFVLDEIKKADFKLLKKYPQISGDLFKIEIEIINKIKSIVIDD